MSSAIVGEQTLTNMRSVADLHMLVGDLVENRWIPTNGAFRTGKLAGLFVSQSRRWR